MNRLGGLPRAFEGKYTGRLISDQQGGVGGCDVIMGRDSSIVLSRMEGG